jgi:hypothetical protein
MRLSTYVNAAMIAGITPEHVDVFKSRYPTGTTLRTWIGHMIRRDLHVGNFIDKIPNMSVERRRVIRKSVQNMIIAHVKSQECLDKNRLAIFETGRPRI